MALCVDTTIFIVSCPAYKSVLSFLYINKHMAAMLNSEHIWKRRLAAIYSTGTWCQQVAQQVKSWRNLSRMLHYCGLDLYDIPGRGGVYAEIVHSGFPAWEWQMSYFRVDWEPTITHVFFDVCRKVIEDCYCEDVRYDLILFLILNDGDCNLMIPDDDGRYSLLALATKYNRKGVLDIMM